MFDERNIIFEDDTLLIVNKPSGVLSVPTPKKERHTLTGLIDKMMQERNLPERSYLCHRLDRDTSGLIIYAKNRLSRDLIMQQFRAGAVEKTYIAFVRGRVNRASVTLSFPIEGKKSITKYKLLQIRKGYSIIEAKPLTGRTNQIRIHFAMIGHPLLGERKFAFGKDFNVRFRRVALHASEIQFRHPKSGKLARFRCVLPEDMSRLIGGQTKFIGNNSV